VRSADDGHDLPETLVHGNLLHNPDHALLSDEGPVAINWKAAGRGPRLADFAWLMWGTWRNAASIDAAVNAYRRHVELTDEELDRLEGVMYIRPLYLVCFDYRRFLTNGHQPTTADGLWNFIDAEYISATAAATRAIYR
jgi:Ser/Thr protein kinase RdoA (MazF antagonist)